MRRSPLCCFPIVGCCCCCCCCCCFSRSPRIKGYIFLSPRGIRYINITVASRKCAPDSIAFLQTKSIWIPGKIFPDDFNPSAVCVASRMRSESMSMPLKEMVSAISGSPFADRASDNKTAHRRMILPSPQPMSQTTSLACNGTLSMQ